MEKLHDPPFWREVMNLFPQTPLCAAALDLAKASLPGTIVNHSLRVFLVAKWLASLEGGYHRNSTDLELLFVACVCHDLGASERFNGPQRFEVEGADAAADLLRSHEVPDPDCHRVWTAIAVHTSAGIAERISPIARYVRRAVLIDFDDDQRQQAVADGCPYAEFVKLLPRADIERTLANAVVGQARDCQALKPPVSLSWKGTQKHPAASWPGLLLRAHIENPDHEGVNPAF